MLDNTLTHYKLNFKLHTISLHHYLHRHFLDVEVLEVYRPVYFCHARVLSVRLWHLILNAEKQFKINMHVIRCISKIATALVIHEVIHVPS